jgi:hypothetical protein
MPKATQLVLSLESKPGVLAKVCGVLAGAGVNIAGLYAAETAGRGKIRLLVDDRAEAKQALQAAKYRVSEEPVLVMELENRPGRMADVAKTLADARINIKYVYATAGTSTGVTVVIAVSNVDKAAALVGY